MIGYYRGVTLVELVIVVAIAAILASLAYPSYQRYLLTSHRVAAKKMLLDGANRQETYFMDFNQYASSAGALGLPLLTETGSYQLTVSATATTFVLSATAAAGQTADIGCLVFSVDQDGTKGAQDGDGNSNSRCWE